MSDICSCCIWKKKKGESFKQFRMRVMRMKSRIGFFCLLILCGIGIYFLQSYLNDYGLQGVREWVANGYCKNKGKENEAQYYLAVKDMSLDSGLKAGETIFVNGLGCGEWFTALNKSFSKLQLYGADINVYKIDYVKTLGKSHLIHAESPWKLGDIKFKPTGKEQLVRMFDRAVVSDIIDGLASKEMCETLKQMLPLVKPGGSVFIFNSFESCSVSANGKSVLPLCFWSRECLGNRQDISEMLYRVSKHPNNSKICTTSISIHKTVYLAGSHGDVKVDSYYKKERHNHKCTVSNFMNSTAINDVKSNKEKIMDAVKKVKENGIII